MSALTLYELDLVPVISREVAHIAFVLLSAIFQYGEPGRLIHTGMVLPWGREV
jgi:hypothetical protein